MHNITFKGRQSGHLSPGYCNMQENQKKNKWGIGLLAFTTTLREGLESVIFLTGVTAGIPLKAVPIAGLVGILLGVSVGVLLYYT